MQLKDPISLQDCASFLNCRFAGNGSDIITGINEIHKVVNGDLTFVDFAKYYDKALKSAATFIIINKEVDVPEGKGLLFSDDPFRDYVKLVKHFSPFNPSLKNVAENAVVGEGTCLLYTSDAADERSSVDLGGRRIIKKKNKEMTSSGEITKKKDYANI